jgi:hypothetical protein
MYRKGSNTNPINRTLNTQWYVFRPSKMQYVWLDNHGWKKETEETQTGTPLLLIFYYTRHISDPLYNIGAADIHGKS